MEAEEMLAEEAAVAGIGLGVETGDGEAEDAEGGRRPSSSGQVLVTEYLEEHVPALPVA